MAPEATRRRRLRYIVGGVFAATMLALCCVGFDNVNFWELLAIPTAAATVAYAIGHAALGRRSA